MGKDKAKKAGQASAAGARASGFGGGGSFGGCAPEFSRLSRVSPGRHPRDLSSSSRCPRCATPDRLSLPISLTLAQDRVRWILRRAIPVVADLRRCRGRGRGGRRPGEGHGPTREAQHLDQAQGPRGPRRRVRRARVRRRRRGRAASAPYARSPGGCALQWTLAYPGSTWTTPSPSKSRRRRWRLSRAPTGLEAPQAPGPSLVVRRTRSDETVARERSAPLSRSFPPPTARTPAVRARRDFGPGFGESPRQVPGRDAGRAPTSAPSATSVCSRARSGPSAGSPSAPSSAPISTPRNRRRRRRWKSSAPRLTPPGA